VGVRLILLCDNKVITELDDDEVAEILISFLKNELEVDCEASELVAIPIND
jgi:hypothetical protein